MKEEALKLADIAEVPLVELLESVPKNARFVLEEELSATYYPVGDWCHKASDMIRKLVAELDKQSLLLQTYAISKEALKPLSDEEIKQIITKKAHYGCIAKDDYIDFARAIEERHGIK